MRTPRTIVALAILFSALPIGALKALAHATPITYSPEASSVVTQSPDKIQIKFSERVENGASSITVLSPDGTAAAGTATVDQSDSHLFSAPFTGTAQGTYTVSWQVVSADDGHFTKGAFVFSIGEQTLTTKTIGAGFQIVHSSALPEATLIWLELIGGALLLAVLVLVLFLWRPLRRNNPELEDISRKINLLMFTGVILILLGSLPYVIIKSLEVSTLQGIPLKNALIAFSGTTSGMYTLLRGILSLIFLGFFIKARRAFLDSSRVTAYDISMMGCLLLMDLMRARVSHAAASHTWPEFSVFVNFLHLLSKDFWAGAVIVALVVLPVVLRTKSGKAIAYWTERFSKIMSAAMAATAATGAYIVWLHLKNPDNMFTTEWGSRFVILSLLGGILLALRLYQQVLADRSLARGLMNSSNRMDGLVSRLSSYALPAEAVVGLGLLFATAFIIITTPPITLKPGFAVQTESQGVTVKLTSDPFNEKEMLTAFENTENGKPASIKSVVITATNQERSIGPLVLDYSQVGYGRYAIPTSQLAAPGKWDIAVTGQRTSGYDATAEFSLTSPKDIQQNTDLKENRDFDLLAFLAIFSAVGGVVLGFILWKWSSYNWRNRTEISSAGTTSYSRSPTIGLAAGAILLCLSWLAYTTILKGEFQTACDTNGDLWEQTVPMNSGNATAQTAVSGCSTGIGLGAFHFGNLNEYTYFRRAGNVEVKMALSDEKPETGKPVNMTFSVSENGQPESELTYEHDRLMHVVIVSEDFRTFAHLHPEEQPDFTQAMARDGKFPLSYTFPKAGRYMVSLDFQIRAKHYSKQFLIDVTGEPDMESLLSNTSSTTEFSDYSVTFQKPESITSRKTSSFRYSIYKNGQPVTDLAPYLGAPMHIAIVSEDLASFTHTHGLLPRSLWQKINGPSGVHAIHASLPAAFGPDILADLEFPRPGTYHIFGEFFHDRKPVVTHFTVNVQ